jgi:hypothetical protein
MNFSKKHLAKLYKKIKNLLASNKSYKLVWLKSRKNTNCYIAKTQ